MKKAATWMIPAILWLTSAFTPAPASKTWKAVLRLEGMGKSYSFTSEAIYGGYQAENQRIFLFGKNHMFLNYSEPEAMKVFHDLCTTNAMQQFQFEANGIANLKAPAKARKVSGNISFRKKLPVSAFLQSALLPNGEKTPAIETSGDLKSLGYTFTEEAGRMFSGKYTITFISSN